MKCSVSSLPKAQRGVLRARNGAGSMVGNGADGPCFVGPHHSSGGTDVSSNIPEMAALARDAKEGSRARVCPGKRGLPAGEDVSWGLWQAQ